MTSDHDRSRGVHAAYAEAEAPDCVVTLPRGLILLTRHFIVATRLPRALVLTIAAGVASAAENRINHAVEIVPKLIKIVAFVAVAAPIVHIAAIVAASLSFGLVATVFVVARIGLIAILILLIFLFVIAGLVRARRTAPLRVIE